MQTDHDRPSAGTETPGEAAGGSVRITCEREIGKWTIRINGKYAADFWREGVARRVAMAIRDALERR